jgi:hypothetical protein
MAGKKKFTNARDAFYATKKVPEYVDITASGDWGELEFKARKMTYGEVVKFSKLKDSDDLVEGILYLSEIGVITNADGSVMFEKADKDSMLGSEMSDVLVDIYSEVGKIFGAQIEEGKEKN